MESSKPTEKQERSFKSKLFRQPNEIAFPIFLKFPFERNDFCKTVRSSEWKTVAIKNSWSYHVIQNKKLFKL